MIASIFAQISKISCQLKFNPLTTLIITRQFAKKIEEVHLPAVFGADSLMRCITGIHVADKDGIARKGIAERPASRCARSYLNRSEIPQPFYFPGIASGKGHIPR